MGERNRFDQPFFNCLPSILTWLTDCLALFFIRIYVSGYIFFSGSDLHIEFGIIIHVPGVWERVEMWVLKYAREYSEETVGGYVLMNDDSGEEISPLLTPEATYGHILCKKPSQQLKQLRLTRSSFFSSFAWSGTHLKQAKLELVFAIWPKLRLRLSSA